MKGLIEERLYKGGKDTVRFLKDVHRRSKLTTDFFSNFLEDHFGCDYPDSKKKNYTYYVFRGSNFERSGNKITGFVYFK